MNLDRPIFADKDYYSVDDLNAIIARLAANDDALKQVIDNLLQYFSGDPEPVGVTPSPAQLQAAIDAMYDSGSTVARNWIVSPPDRTLQEIMNLFEIEPMVDLLEGVRVNAQAWLPLLRLFGMLRGMIYLVEDGPDYDADPTYIKDGSFFFTAPTDLNNPTHHLLISSDGTPLSVNGYVYRPLPLGVNAITLVEYLLRRLELKRLRQLYRIGSFEMGIDSKYDSASTYDFLANAFKVDGQFIKRLPCGYTDSGDILYLRSQAGRYRGDNLIHFMPQSTNGGVEERVIIDESMVQTPMGLFRVPKCILRWDHLISDSDRQSTPAGGDPVFFIGLMFSVSLVGRGGYSEGTAIPSQIDTLGLGSGIIMLEKDAIVGVISNHPGKLTGTKAERYPLISADGHEQGRIIGYIQKDGSTQFSQYAQVQMDVVVVPMHARPFFDAGTLVDPGQIDEVGKLGEFISPVDQPPWRAFGIGSRRALKVVATQRPDFSMDVDQGILIKHINGSGLINQTCILPVGLYLAKNNQPFSLPNLNGCTTRFQDAWAIRTITSAQESLNTIIFADVDGTPENFPKDFVGAELKIWHADGTTSLTTIVERVGDRLARIPKDVVAKVRPGDIATIDRRVPSSSYDGAYNREVSEANFIDLRLRVCRLIDAQIIPSADGSYSPSPSPAQPWTAIRRSRPDSLVSAAMAPMADKLAQTGSKLRWNYAQSFMALASQRRDMVDLSGSAIELESFLTRWVKNYPANKDREWIVGEGAIIAWPEQTPVTKVSLRRYSPPVLPGTDDGITVEEVEEWGQVPVLTKHLLAGDHIRYPLRFVRGLVFVSERSFQIPGHAKLSGSFRFDPEDTWIVEQTVTFQLFQTKNRNGVKQRVLLGTFDIKKDEATSFVNATGVFRIDGDAQYNPSTGFININYNQTIDFTVDEPGELNPTIVYHDLAEIHPIYSFDLGSFGLSVSHLFEVKGFSIVEGEIKEMPDTIRLEGITINNGMVYLRMNRDDTFKVLAQKGVFKTKWVLRDIPVVTIDKVNYDDNGIPSSVEYSASVVKDAMTISTLLEKDSRCKQTYIPCKVKYGWIDLAQTNIHTEAIPENPSPKFGFFEKVDALFEDKSLNIDGPVNYSFAPSDIDYRFLGSYTGTTGMEAIKSVAIARNYKTGEIRTFVGAYRTANGGGEITALDSEITLDDLSQPAVFVYDTTMDQDWVLDFAGVLVAVDDDTAASTPSGKSKLAMVGYWYNGHTVTERVQRTVRFRPDCVQFNSPEKNSDFWRIGDLPMSFLYRGNNLLWSDHKRPLP